MKYGTIEFLKKLFGPLKENHFLWIQMLGESIMRGSKSYISLLIMQYVAEMMEKNNFELFSIAVSSLIAFYLVFELVSWLLRHRGWVTFYFPFKQLLHQIVFRDYVSLNNTYTEKIGTGKTISIINTGLHAWTQAAMDLIDYSVKFIFAIGFGFYFVAKVSLVYAVLYIVFLIVVFYFVFLINKKVIIYRDKRRDENHNRNRKAVKIIMSKFEVLISGKIHHEIKSLDSSIEQQQSYNLQQNDRMYWLFNVPAFFINLVRIAVYLFVGYGYFEGLYSLSEFTTFLGLLIIFDTSILDIIEFYRDFTKNSSDITKLRELFDNAPDPIDYTAGKGFEYKTGDIRINNLCFQYSQGKNVFENFSLTIQGGKKTALVGLSGAGKTTLMKLLAGYMHADDGEIVVDNQLLSDVSLKSYFNHIGYLTQEPSVFDGSVRDNLLYGVVDTTGNSEKQLEEALKLSNCDFVKDLPQGLDTHIGEKGVKLSGGQRQRLAIAKIFLKNPKIILLDEPTSALDSISEKMVSDAFNNLFQDRTVIVIAHRLQTVKQSDEIIVLGLKEGVSQVLEKGTHHELSTRGGTYQEMLELQSGFNF